MATFGDHPAEFPRSRPVLHGFTLSERVGKFTIPTTGDSRSSYQVFVALVRPGTTATGRVEPSDILPVDTEEIVAKW
jgi:acyl dehydratase